MSEITRSERFSDAQAKYEIFLSYARTDNKPQKEGDIQGWVDALRDEILIDQRLHSTEPLRIFLDTDEIKDMDDWRHRILEGLRHSRILLVCLSPNYFKSEYCRWEWEEYCRRQVHSLMGQDSIASIFFVDVPESDMELNRESINEWMTEVSRPNLTDLRPWFPHGVEALSQLEAKAKVTALGLSLWQRIERARRATGVPGNLRRHNPHFVGRKTELRQLHENLKGGAVGVVTAVHGLGGQGKTELAVAYANGWADCYPGGLWVLKAEGKKDLLPLIGELTNDLGIPARDANDETEEQRGRRVLVELRRRALRVKDQDPDGGAACLVLLDNVSESVLLSDPQISKIPREDWLRIVATTRLGEDALTASRKKSLAFVAVDALKEEDAVALIREHQPDGKCQFPEDEAAAVKIVKELGCFTLAIETVAIYLGLYPDIRPELYLERLREEGLPSSDDLGRDADVATQMEHNEKQLSIILSDTISSLGKDELAEAELTALNIASLLPPDSIPWPWLRDIVEKLHPGLIEQKKGYPDPWLKVRRRLEGLRLLTPGDHPEICRLHRLVGAHLAGRLNNETREVLIASIYACIRRYADLINATYDHKAAHRWVVIPLEETLRHFDSEYADIVLGFAAGVVGNIEMRHGSFSAAGEFFLMSMGHIEHLYETDAENKAVYYGWIQSFFGDFYLRRGREGDAELALVCFNKSLEISQKIYEQNPDSYQAARNVATSQYWLGVFYLRRGRKGDAEQALLCFNQSLEIRQKIYEQNPDSSEAARDVSGSQKSLGDFYLRRGIEGDAEQALVCVNKSLEISQKIYEQNPDSSEAARDVATSQYWLGNFYLRRGRKGDAEQALLCFNKSLEISQKIYEQNPDSYQAVRNVAASEIKLGDYYLRRGIEGDAELALACFNKSLEIFQKIYEQNPDSSEAARDVSVSENKLGYFYLRRGRKGDAEQALLCFNKSFKISQKNYEQNLDSYQAARDVATSQYCLGDFYLRHGRKGNAEQALLCFNKSLEISQKIYEQNPDSSEAARDVSLSKQRLGDFYLRRGREGDAEQALLCFNNSLEINQKIYEQNQDSIAAARDLVMSYFYTGTLAFKTDNNKMASKHFSACYSIIRSHIKAGFSWDTDVLRFYESLQILGKKD